MTTMTNKDKSDFTYSNIAAKSTTLETLKRMHEAPKNEMENRLAQTISSLLSTHGVNYVDKNGPSLKELENNDDFKNLMCVLLSLGRAAKSDHQELKKIAKQSQNFVYGLTGTPLPQTNQEAIVMPELNKDASEDEFKKSIALCEHEIKELNNKLSELTRHQKEISECLNLSECNLDQEKQNLKLLEEHLNQLGGHLQKMMTHWRRHEAILHNKHDLSKETISTTMSHLQDVFTGAYNLSRYEVSGCKPFDEDRVPSSNLHQCLKVLKSIINKNAWCYNKQPPKCVEVARGQSREFELEIRIFGISEDQLDRNITWNYFLEKGSENKIIRKQIKVIGATSVQSTECGLLISVKVRLEGYNRTTKRTSEESFDHFNRILCHIKLKMSPTLEVTLECCSLPFTVRTGNPQLWPYTGAVDWYCWAKEDLYMQPFLCPKDMNMEDVLSMLQAKYEVIDPGGFTAENIKTLQNMIESFSKGKCIKMHDFIQKNMPYQKRHKQKNHNAHNAPSFYTWFVAACNTAEKFKENHLILKTEDDKKFRFIASFLSYEDCLLSLKGQPVGSAILRISQNHVNKTKSSLPFASIVVAVVSDAEDTGNSVLHHIYNCDNEENLIRELADMALPNKDQLIKKIIHPRDIPFDEIKLSYPDNLTINENGYCTQTTERRTIVLHKSAISSSRIETSVAESTGADDEIPTPPTKIQRTFDSPSQSNEPSEKTLPTDLISLKDSDLLPISPSNFEEMYKLLQQQFDNDSKDVN